MKQQYSFVTKWEIEAPLQQVWQAVYASLEWLLWWKGIVSVVEIEKEDANGLNSVHAYTWKSVLPYQLTFTMRLTEKQPLKRLKGVAFGDLEGQGVWTFSEQDGLVRIQYNWDVYTKKAWMNYLSFILKPVFRYNHDIVMHWGALGLAKKLNARLVSG